METTIEERSKLAVAAVDHACRQILGADLFDLARQHPQFEPAREEMAQILVRLTFVDDLYLLPENLSWAGRCLLHISQVREGLRQARLRSADVPDLSESARLIVAALTIPFLPGHDRDIESPPAGLTYEILIEHLNVANAEPN